MSRYAFIGLFCCFLMSSACLAAEDLSLIKRVVIFPTLVEKSLTAKADEAWWQMREELTAQKRLLVASRQFLVRNDVYQARSELSPADAILLGKLLDAHAILTSQLKDRKLFMQAYDAGSGSRLWQQELQFSPSLTIADQLVQVSRRLVRDFEAHLPYHGHVVVDPLIGSPTYKEAGQRVVQVDFGPMAQLEVGDTVQWVRLKPSSLEPILQGGGQLSVFAEGKILRNSQGLAIVLLERVVEGHSIAEFQLVRSSREWDRLRKNLIKVELGLNTDMVVRTANQEGKWQTENKPVATTLSVVGSIATFLLLAF